MTRLSSVHAVTRSRLAAGSIGRVAKEWRTTTREKRVVVSLLPVQRTRLPTHSPRGTDKGAVRAFKKPSYSSNHRTKIGNSPLSISLTTLLTLLPSSPPSPSPSSSLPFPPNPSNPNVGKIVRFACLA